MHILLEVPNNFGASRSLIYSESFLLCVSHFCCVFRLVSGLWLNSMFSS